MNNIVQRTLSGAVFIFVIIGSILWHPYAFAGVFLIVVIWSLLEFYDIVALDRVHAGKWIGVASGVFLFASSFFYAQALVEAKIFTILIPVMVILFISHIYHTDRYAFRSAAYTVMGLVYIAFPFALCNGLVFPYHDQQYIPGILIGFFILLWTNDTFAYLTGMVLGKHRLFERISPKKSWEGFLGGLFFTIAMSLLIAKLFPILPFYHWMAISAIIVIFGVYGDLLESLLKRNLGIKDSGHFLPGHGGILDRFDAVFLALPMVCFYLTLFVFGQ
ncbi:MAG: phosphatidate cytidylyltransferase [Bacteroidales bacterium]|nr:phosphatidate cytidylyltransferase [Bacteroidales bacterium]